MNQLEKLEAARSAYLLYLPFLALPCLSRPYCAFLSQLGLTGPYWALLSLLGFLTRPYWALLGLTRPYWALLGLTGPYWALIGLTLHLSNWLTDELTVALTYITTYWAAFAAKNKEKLSRLLTVFAVLSNMNGHGCMVVWSPSNTCIMV